MFVVVIELSLLSSYCYYCCVY